MCTTTTPGGWEKATGNPMDGERNPASENSPLLTNAPLCQARTRAGRSCRCPVVRGRHRCRMHGGKNAGAPKGQANGMWKHGGETREAVALRTQASRLVRLLAKPDRHPLEAI